MWWVQMASAVASGFAHVIMASVPDHEADVIFPSEGNSSLDMCDRRDVYCIVDVSAHIADGASRCKWIAGVVRPPWCHDGARR